MKTPSNVCFGALIALSSPLVFTQFQLVKQPATPGLYEDVLIIQKGIAKGHFAVKEGNRVVNFDRENPAHEQLQKYQIVIGDDTLNDVVRCGEEAIKTKCKLDHGATVRDIVGFYAGFRRDGDQVRGDLALMKSTQHREYVEELFADFSAKVGNSIDFDYKYEIQGDVAVARCIKLNSVDIVDAPAATNSLFNEQPTNPPTDMPLNADDLAAIGGLIDTKLTAHKQELETKFTTLTTDLSKKFEEGKDDDEKEKKEDDDKDGEGKSSMSAKEITKTVFAAVQAALPKAAVNNLASDGGNPAPVKDEYQEKVNLALAAGIPPHRITHHMAATHPALYTAKFGNGGGQKGSAKTNATL